MKNYLLRSSCLLAFLCCHYVLSGQNANVHANSKIQIPYFNSIKYRAAIDVVGKHLSGILIFKMQADGSIRAVFVNEMGSTFFDITFNETSYEYNSVISSLSKKAVKRTLAKDLGMILIRGIYKSLQVVSTNENFVELKLKRKGKVRYYPAKFYAQYPIVENIGRKKVITISQHYAGESSLPDSIFLQHHTVNFTISLKQMNVTE